MKSFVANPPDFEKMLFPDADDRNISGKLLAHYELYKKVSKIEGSIVKCGIAAEEEISRLAMFRNLIAAETNEKVIVFEKLTKGLLFNNNLYESETFHNQAATGITNIERIQASLLTKGIKEKIDFVPGNLEDSISDYLIINPELKISYLTIDLNDYEATLTSLQFFFPRLVHGGVLILDNYYKKEGEYKAATDYFKYAAVKINNFSVNKGPHYIIQE